MTLYKKPNCSVEEIHLDNMIALSYGGAEANENTTVLGKGHRGTWGDLWASDEDEE